jgi:hypothetical protein
VCFRSKLQFSISQEKEKKRRAAEAQVSHLVLLKEAEDLIWEAEKDNRSIFKFAEIFAWTNLFDMRPTDLS